MTEIELARYAQLMKIRKRLIVIIHAIEPESPMRSKLIYEAQQLQAEHQVLFGDVFNFENDITWDAALADT